MSCPSSDALARFVDGTLPHDDAQHVEAHLDRCSACRRTVSAAGRAGGNVTRRVGRYTLLAPLGAGAMGVVYAAYDPELDRKIAIKLLTGDSEHDAVRRARLTREARALARISHPNVVPVHDVGVADGQLYIAMELVDGDNLRAHVHERAISFAERLALILQAARGLAAAHAVGITHRDLKPDNILVGSDGRVRVGDFGLAATDTAVNTTAPSSGSPTITQSGATLGTPAYMAPEQLAGEPASAASDQFALCATAWEVLFGERPSRGSTAEELRAAAQTPPSPPRGADPRVVSVLQKGLSADPSRRYRDIVSLIAALERPPRRRWPIAAAGTAFVALAATRLLLARSHDSAPRCTEPPPPVTPTMRIALAGAFAHSGSPLAGEAMAATTRALDRWSGRYGVAYVQLCRDAPRTFERCFRAHRDELDAALAVLVDDPDATTVEHAATALLALDPADCDESRTPTTHPALSHVRALRRAGQYASALTAASALETTDPALAADVELELGISSAALGKLDEARDHFSRAAARADAARDDHLRATALIEALEVVGDHAVDLQEASRLEEQARAAVERAGAPRRLQADLAEARGAVATRRGQLTEARELLTDAVTIYRTSLPIDDAQLAGALVAAAQVHAETGEPQRALTELTDARALAEAALGPHHPNVAIALLASLEPLVLLERYDEAKVAGTRAIAIYEHAPATDPTTLARALTNVAIVMHMADSDADAIALLVRARGILETRNPDTNVELATLLLNLGSIYKDLDRHDDAIPCYERTLAIWTRTLGPEHVDLARPLTALGEIYVARRDRTHALAVLERAMALREHAGANIPPSHLAHTRELLARARALR